MWKVETLSLLFVPPAKGGGMEIIMKRNIIVTLIIMTAICAGCEKGESNTEKYTGKPNKTEVAVDAAGMEEMDASYNTIQELMVDADYVVYA